MRADRRASGPIAAAAALDLAALLLLVAQPHAWMVLPSGALHATAAVAMLRLRGDEPTRRLLAAAMMFTLPLVGVALAVFVVRLRGRGGDELLIRQRPPRRSESGVELARRLTAGGSLCEALLAGDREARLVAVARLRCEANGRAIALLRGSLSQRDPDLALDAALALEELAAHHAERTALACAEVERRPCRDTALAAAEAIAGAIHDGLAEPGLVPAIAAHARRYYRMAAELDEPRAKELAWGRARLELAVLDPEAALAVLEPVFREHAEDDRLAAIYRDAAHAARRFERLASAEPSGSVPLLDPETPPPPAVLRALAASDEALARDRSPSGAQPGGGSEPRPELAPEPPAIALGATR
ncbi:MAG TPA: hypothetical protein VFT22_42425 [Kofleriaceae bacterium]|nr:hypothetical protein [Kofleriaceae bacterium]